MDAKRRRIGTPGPASEYEYVDAGAPEWSGAEVERYEGSDPSREEGLDAPDRLRAAARQRLRDETTRSRRQRPVSLESPWLQRRLDETSFCVIDFETTGGGRDQDDEILEMGAVLVGQGEMGREFSTLVDPRRPIMPAAHSVHGIAAAALHRAPILEHALPWLLEMTRDRVLVFHNARFDLPFLQRALQETHQEPLEQPVLDTVVFARHVVGPPCRLGVLGERLGLPMGTLHRALDDARLTARLLIELLQLVGDAGWRTLDELPGLAMATRHIRGRRHSRLDPLVQRFETAARRREALRVTYHAGGGVAPMDLHLLPLRLLAGVGLLAEDLDRGTTLQLELGRVGQVRRAR